MPTDTEQVQYNHFAIPAQPNFLNEAQLKLTDASKKFFEQGCPGQGYVGLVDITTGLIHLFPAFNKNDGQLRSGKDGKDFSKYASTEQTLGGGAGDLHMRSASMLSLGDRAGNKNQLMGFGIWKGGQSVKFLSELPENSLRLIPDEYIVTKDKNNEWKIYYVSDKKEIREITLNDVQLEALAKLPKDKSPDKLTFEERRSIENTLPITDPGDLKLIKNRSSSQNMFSCKYDPAYGSFFNHMMPEGHGGSHMVALQRELPLPVLSKIVNSICIDNNIPTMGNLEHSHLVPNEENDNRLRYHLQVESYWIRFEQILGKLNSQTKENRELIAKYYNAGLSKWGESDTNKFLSRIETLVDTGELSHESFALMIKYQHQYKEIEGIFDSNFRNLIENILRESPDVLNNVINAIDIHLQQTGGVNVSKRICGALIQSMQNGQLKLTNENIKPITEFIVDRVSDSANIEALWNILEHLKKTNKVESSIIENVTQDMTSAILRQMFDKVSRSNEVSEENIKVIAFLEEHELIKSKNSIFIAHSIKHYDKMESEVLKMTRLFSDGSCSADSVYNAMFNKNDIATFIELAKDMVNKGDENALYFFKMAVDWNSPELLDSLKTVFPNESLVYTALEKKLALMNTFWNNEDVSYRLAKDPSNDIFSLQIIPPTIETFDEEGYSNFQPCDFKDSIPKILQSLEDLGFPKEVLEKVGKDLAANPATYAIELDQATQSAIINKNKEPAVKEPAVKEPAVKEPAVKEPAVKEPAVKEPAVKALAVKESAVQTQEKDAHRAPVLTTSLQHHRESHHIQTSVAPSHAPESTAPKVEKAEEAPQVEPRKDHKHTF